MSRKFDVIIYGATGYTGQLCVKYMHLRASSAKVNWAIAGRNSVKLQAMLKDLNIISVPILTVSLDDVVQIDDMVKQTYCVLACAGPFALYGEPLVASCVRNHTDYTDITGESPYIARLIKRYHDSAVSKGVRIVPSCGFDSVPSDLGALICVDALKRKHKTGTVRVDAVFKISGGGVSGGTMQTILAMEPEAEVPNIHDPLLLNPETVRDPEVLRASQDPILPSFNSDLKCYTGPFVMAFANTRIVRRSAALMDYGKQFVYSEKTQCRSLVGAVMASLKLLALGILMILPRSLVPRLVSLLGLPAPGTGPDEAVRRRSSYVVTLVGRDSEGHCVKGIVSGGEGYEATGTMSVEAAILLAKTRKSEKSLTGMGGVLTSASAFGLGLDLVAALKTTGLGFETSSL